MDAARAPGSRIPFPPSSPLSLANRPPPPSFMLLAKTRSFQVLIKRASALSQLTLLAQSDCHGLFLAFYHRTLF
jgi:hypothetical protein